MTAPLPEGLRAEWAWRDNVPRNHRGGYVATLGNFVLWVTERPLRGVWTAEAAWWEQASADFACNYETRDEALFAAERAARRERRLRRDAELRAEGKTWTYVVVVNDEQYLTGEEELADTQRTATHFMRYRDVAEGIRERRAERLRDDFAGPEKYLVVRLIRRTKKVAP